MLVSLFGRRWNSVQLVMLTLFIDDSGTDPKQAVAIASALIIPAARIERLEREWNRFRAKEGFKCFHASPFIARNQKSEFANWDDAKVSRVFKRVRQICLKYGARAVSVAVNKKDYDEVAPEDFRRLVDRDHYAWAVRHLIGIVDKMILPPIQREFIFQWIERRVPARREIENIMDQMQQLAEEGNERADYGDPHFRKSDDIPGLQCVDGIGWVSYRYALQIFKKTQLPPIAEESWSEFGGPRGHDGWLRAVTLRREALDRGINKMMENKKFMEFFERWKEAHSGKQGIRKIRPNHA